MPRVSSLMASIISSLKGWSLNRSLASGRDDLGALEGQVCADGLGHLFLDGGEVIVG